MSQRRKGGYPITDRAGLGVLLAESVKERYRGNQRAAARALAHLGCHQRELSRLIRGEIGAITERTVAWVMVLVPKAKHPVLRSLLLTPRARRLLDAYRRWITVRVTPPAVQGSMQCSVMEQWRYVQRLDLLSTLGRTIRRLLEEFHTWAHGKGHHDDRIQVAIERVLDPLLESEPSGYLERHWSEMKEREMETFVRAGLTQERILLRRVPDVQRAQEMADSPLPARCRRETLRSWAADAGPLDVASFQLHLPEY
jgi:hypothetical protein